jgi:hypothetical protein
MLPLLLPSLTSRSDVSDIAPQLGRRQTKGVRAGALESASGPIASYPVSLTFFLPSERAALPRSDLASDRTVCKLSPRNVRLRRAAHVGDLPGSKRRESWHVPLGRAPHLDSLKPTVHEDRAITSTRPGI